MNSDNININIVKIGENKARCLIEIKNNKDIKRYIRNIKYNLILMNSYIVYYIN